MPQRHHDRVDDSSPAAAHRAGGRIAGQHHPVGHSNTRANADVRAQARVGWSGVHHWSPVAVGRIGPLHHGAVSQHSGLSELSSFAAAGLPDFFAPGVTAAFVLTALRVGGLLLVAPVWSAKSVPMRLRSALLVIFSVLLMPASTAGVNSDLLRITPATFFGESAIGMVIGLSAAIVIAAAEAAGEQMTVSIGLSGAAIFDPINNTQGAILAQFMQMLAVVVLLVGGGHLVMIRAVAESFRVMPLGASLNISAGFGAFVPMARSLFSSGMQFAAPVIAAVLVMNIALAVLGRAAPKLQVMSVAFPLQIGVGLLTLSGTLALIIRVMSDWTPGFGANIEAFARAAGAASAASVVR